MFVRLFVSLALVGCVAAATPLVAEDPKKPPETSSYLMSLLWTQTAAEHEALCEQAYALARQQLCVALHDRCWTADVDQRAAGGYACKPPAVILDIDETVLDNAPYNAELTLEHLAGGAPDEFDQARWYGWTSTPRARGLPGAIPFLQFARGRGVAVWFVTNREDKEAAATLENLAQLGFPTRAENLLTKNEAAGRPSEKRSRRAHVAAGHRILLLLGDDLGDFVPGAKSASLAERAQAIAAQRAWLGTRWIFLPNPIYGSWTRSLGKPDERKGHLVGFGTK
jgi:5'-nucleotidase (lipoprotein e(P4) family)